MSPEQKPLHVLTIDGGGYQGIASLLIIDTLMKRIAKPSKDQSPTRPCEVFDVIGGVGTGGWLALLLGRFRLTISQCLYEYFNLVSSMTRRKAALRPSSQTIHRNGYDVEGLTSYVDYLTDKYKTGQYLLDNDADGAGCKHAFAAASYREKHGQESRFCLFRSYEPIEHTPTLDPAKTRISDAFAATGAKKGFLSPFKICKEGGSTLTFGKELFNEYSTSATMYAFNEIRQQYGDKGYVPVIINIGPGIPDLEDITSLEKTKHKLHWRSSKINPPISIAGHPASTTREPPRPTHDTEPPSGPSDGKTRKHSLRFRLFHSNSSTKSNGVQRSWSWDVREWERIKDGKASAEKNVKDALTQIYPGHKYVRLGLEKAPRLSTSSDLGTSEETQRETEQYLDSDEVKLSIDKFWSEGIGVGG
ncbi:MAG: hypothetical protein M1813_004748 [Trichoglossum hirsutum]|nr:MAG: hypothetical protein M1813_004748 [Trichoglossum hirsutum]